jgi:cytochrome c556
MLLTASLARRVAGAALATVVVIPVAVAQGNVLEERKQGFRSMGQSMEAIQRIVENRQPVAGAVAPARVIAEFAPKIKGLFPPGSDRGETRALPAIWSDRAGFDRVADAMVPAATALLAAAESGDAARLGAQLQATGQACGACHRPYRAPAR